MPKMKVASDFQACSGATIDSVVQYQIPYLQGLAHCPPATPLESTAGCHPDQSDVSLVTLGVGGDDLGFNGVITRCLLRPSTNLILAAGGVLAIPVAVLANLFGAVGACYGNEQTALERALKCIDARSTPADWGCEGKAIDPPLGVQFTLADLYLEIKALVPGSARIIVLGYPQMFYPTTGHDCDHFDYTDTVAFNTLVTTLDGVIQANAQKAGVEYAPNVINSFAGHGLCSSGADSWINGLTVTGDHCLKGGSLGSVGTAPPIGPYPIPGGITVQLPSLPTPVCSYHPNAGGQAELAQLVYDEWVGGQNASTPIPVAQLPGHSTAGAGGFGPWVTFVEAPSQRDAGYRFAFRISGLSVSPAQPGFSDVTATIQVQNLYTDRDAPFDFQNQNLLVGLGLTKGQAASAYLLAGSYHDAVINSFNSTPWCYITTDKPIGWEILGFPSHVCDFVPMPVLDAGQDWDGSTIPAEATVSINLAWWPHIPSSIPFQELRAYASYGPIAGPNDAQAWQPVGFLPLPPPIVLAEVPPVTPS